MKSSNVLVTVIIPVFNTAEYLNEAIGSILRQTLQELEIVAIDDCSSDNSLQILRELAAADSRIKVIAMPQNQGQSVCRNKGLEIAKGEYIYFFDSDDILEEDCLQLCYEKCTELQTDLLLFDGKSFTENGLSLEFNPKYDRTGFFTKSVSTGLETIETMYKNKAYSCSVCLIFIRKSYLDQTGLRFYPGVFYEDVLFSMLLYLQAKRVSSIRRTFFHRRIRSNSVMTSRLSHRNINDRILICNELLSNKKNFSDATSRHLLNLEVRNMMKFLVKNAIIGKHYKLLFSYLNQILALFLKTFS